MYATASTDSAAYIIGGIDDRHNLVTTIAEFKENKWRKVGDLAEGRRDPSSISFGGETLVFGGSSDGR